MLDSKTKLCCIIGNPVEHSLSPIMHNAGYKTLNLNFIFVAFHVTDLKLAVEGIRSLGIKGIVVTVPHKIEIMRSVDEIDETARLIGAVNTIVNDNGILKATNTDWSGALGALLKVTSVKGKRVAVLGAGGAAKAVVYGLKKEGATVTVFNRTISRAQQLAKDFNLDHAGSLDEKGKISECDVIVNTTSLGMEPDIESCAVEQDVIKPSHIVYDIVYTPKETKLLRMAKNKGATVVYGDKMIFYGALPQFELFTGQKAPADVMERALADAIERKNEQS